MIEELTDEQRFEFINKFNFEKDSDSLDDLVRAIYHNTRLVGINYKGKIYKELENSWGGSKDL
tara:strand:+ start:980 stop:1168 length:189 start_codon:yes stop_codon:yes gene_type:complete